MSVCLSIGLGGPMCSYGTCSNLFTREPAPALAPQYLHKTLTWGLPHLLPDLLARGNFAFDRKVFLFGVCGGWVGHMFTIRNSSCGKVMFSQVSVCPQGGGVHPPGQTPPDSSDGHYSGRYASYWNAFLY